MNIKKTVSVAFLAFATAFVSFGTPAFVREYKFTAKLHVPQVLDNSESLGYRKYKSQTLRGTLLMEYAEDGSF